MRIKILILCISSFFSAQLLAQWSKVESITTPYIYSSLFYEDNILVGGDSLYISRDRGQSWAAFAPAGHAIEITALHKINNFIFLGTYGDGVFLSSNNGISWQPINNGLSVFAYYAKKFATSGDTIFYATDGGGVYILKLGLYFWQSYNENLPDRIAWTANDIAVTNTNIILSAGASGYYYLRPKGSSQWIESQIRTPRGTYTTPNTFIAFDYLIFSGSRDGIYRSTDNGNNWDSVGIRALPLNAVCFAKDNNRIYAGFTRSNDFFIWYSDDLGNSWNSMFHEFHYLRNIFIYDYKIWAATNDGFYFISLQPSVADPVVLPSGLKLEQNYPNPFNPSTKISWQSPLSSHTTLKIYDVLGREVATLLDEYREAGSYVIEFNVGQTFSLSPLASGVYFYKLIVGDFTEVKKMILNK